MSITVEPFSQKQYFADSVAAARHSIARASSILRTIPMAASAEEHLEQAVEYARDAAEHLYNAEQMMEPDEGLREALAAATAIMTIVGRLEEVVPHPGTVGDSATRRLLTVDRTLARLESDLGLKGSVPAPIWARG